MEILAPGGLHLSFPQHNRFARFRRLGAGAGLYFVSHWDSNFIPLLSCHDPGEPAQKGGLLGHSTAKGSISIRDMRSSAQLPAGVPGAIRLYVNMLSAGHGDRQ